MKRTFLLLIAITGFYQAKAQIDYSYQVNGLSVTFIITQQGQFYEIVDWDFGDGNSSSGSASSEDTVVHTYSALNTYKVCVRGCPFPISPCDTACKFVLVGSTGIKDNRDGNTIIRIYPNPFSNEHTLIITTDKFLDLKVSLFDITGKKIKRVYQGRSELGNNAIQCKVSSLSAGTYFYEIKLGKEVIHKRFVKQ